MLLLSWSLNTALGLLAVLIAISFLSLRTDGSWSIVKQGRAAHPLWKNTTNTSDFRWALPSFAHPWLKEWGCAFPKCLECSCGSQGRLNGGKSQRLAALHLAVLHVCLEVLCAFWGSCIHFVWKWSKSICLRWRWGNFTVSSFHFPSSPPGHI